MSFVFKFVLSLYRCSQFGVTTSCPDGLTVQFTSPDLRPVTSLPQKLPFAQLVQKYSPLSNPIPQGKQQQ